MISRGGTNVALLTDRLAFSHQGILSRLDNLITQKGAEVISWRCVHENNAFKSNRERSKTVVRYDSDVVVKEVCRNAYGVYARKISPRGLNSCVSKKLIEKIRSDVGRFCVPVNPDYTQAFLQLFYCDQVWHCDFNWVYVTHLLTSNGGACRENLGVCKKSFESLTNGDPYLAYQEVPVKMFSLRNSVANDFLRSARLAKVNLRWSDLEPVSYFCNVFADLVNYQPCPEVSESMAMWERKVEELEPHLRKEVLRRTRVMNSRELNWKGRASSYIRRLGNAVDSGVWSWAGLLDSERPPSQSKRQIETIEHTVMV